MSTAYTFWWSLGVVFLPLIANGFQFSIIIKLKSFCLAISKIGFFHVSILVPGVGLSSAAFMLTQCISNAGCYFTAVVYIDPITMRIV